MAIYRYPQELDYRTIRVGASTEIQEVVGIKCCSTCLSFHVNTFFEKKV